MSSTVYQDKNVCAVDNVQGLILADKYDLKDLTNRLLSFKSSISFNELVNINGSGNLKPETVFKLAVKRIPTILRPESRDESYIVKDTLEEIYRKKQQQQQQEKETKTKSDNFPPESSHPFLEDEHSDVLLKIEGEELHLHSAILSVYSPVFKAMFKQLSPQDGKYVTEIKGRKLEHIVEMLKFLYADKFQKMTSKNFSTFFARGATRRTANTCGGRDICLTDPSLCLY